MQQRSTEILEPTKTLPDVNNLTDLRMDVTVDNVFRQPITNDPEIVDRAAKAMTRDIEGMILYMAVMQYDSQQLMQVKDPATVSALQTSIDKEMTKAEERITKKLKEFGINEETAKSIYDLLDTMKNKLSNGGNRPSDQTFSSSLDRQVHSGQVTISPGCRAPESKSKEKRDGSPTVSFFVDRLA